MKYNFRFIKDSRNLRRTIDCMRRKGYMETTPSHTPTPFTHIRGAARDLRQPSGLRGGYRRDRIPLDFSVLLFIKGLGYAASFS